MTRSRSDRELRRSLLKLRSLPPDDFEAVLDSFDESQRKRVLTLLAELDGAVDEPSAAKTLAGYDQVLLPEDLSPWLAARIHGKKDSADDAADSVSITEHAQAALRRCAAALVPQPPKTPKTPSLVERVMRGFA